MSASELHSYLQSAAQAPLLLDVREPWEYQTCHLDNSRLIPMRRIAGVIHELDPSQEIVVICHHGIRSRSVATYLASNDFNHVINLSGGIDAWAKYVDPAMPSY